MNTLAAPSLPPAPPGVPCPDPASGAAPRGPGGHRPHLRLVTPPPSRASVWRRRSGALVILLVLIVLAIAGIGRVGASADLEDRVAGHVIIEPGQTLWDVAVSTAPDGVDPRAQLTAIKDLNQLNASDVDAWTVVLLPAR